MPRVRSRTQALRATAGNVCPLPAHFGMPFLMGNASGAVGRRVIVTGMAGSGKSTFSRALSARTGLPMIHLDLHYWRPGWLKPSAEEWRVKQCSLLADDTWIADGNCVQTLDLRLDGSDSVVVLDTPWWACAGRAFLRGIRMPAGTEMPDGCKDSAIRRLREKCGRSGSAGLIVVRGRSEKARSSPSMGSTWRSTHAQLEASDPSTRSPALSKWVTLTLELGWVCDASGDDCRQADCRDSVEP